ncbi:MAG: hypothetical protein BGP04_07570 [Rhizobiales bacterium 62-17]|nr:MarR family transcriptional regulator [Hyphomicrobiales bacterium]OJY05263.1 MAG: hypothetical protein BGP04_07570 [Rhizobiales bacterium 62-17]
MVLWGESRHGSPMKQRTLSPEATQDDAVLYHESTMALARMLRVSNLTTSVFERMTGVHIAQWRILSFLAHNPDCTQKQLKDAHQVDPAAITRSVKLLERGKLVVRRTDADDNRLTRVILTPAGEKLVAEVSERRRLYLRQALKDIAPSDIDIFEKVLINLEANTQKMAAAQGD